MHKDYPKAGRLVGQIRQPNAPINHIKLSKANSVTKRFFSVYNLNFADPVKLVSTQTVSSDKLFFLATKCPTVVRCFRNSQKGIEGEKNKREVRQFWMDKERNEENLSRKR